MLRCVLEDMGVIITIEILMIVMQTFIFLGIGRNCTTALLVKYSCLNNQIKEPWSCVNGMRPAIKRTRVQIQAKDTRWIFSHIKLMRKLFRLSRTKISKKRPGNGIKLFKCKYVCNGYYDEIQASNQKSSLYRNTKIPNLPDKIKCSNV